MMNNGFLLFYFIYRQLISEAPESLPLVIISLHFPILLTNSNYYYYYCG